MKKIILGLLGVACIAGFTGCTSINSSDGGSIAIYPKTVGPVDGYRPLYTVNQTKKVSGSAQINVLFGIFAWGDNTGFADNASIASSDSAFAFIASLFPNAKKMASQAAFYDACKKANCDTVVSARYEVKTVDYWVFAKSQAEVKGFPAVQTGVEIVKPLPYYVDPQGKLIVMDKFVTPYKIMDERPVQAQKGFLF